MDSTCSNASNVVTPFGVPSEVLILQMNGTTNKEPEPAWGAKKDHKMSIFADWLERAKNNLLKSLPIVLTLALLTLVKGGDTNEVANALH